MLGLSILATIGVFAAQSAALGVKRFDSSTPFYSHDPNTPADCTLWWNSDDGLSCDTVLTIVGISVSQLTAWVSLTQESRYEAVYFLGFYANSYNRTRRLSLALTGKRTTPTALRALLPAFQRQHPRLLSQPPVRRCLPRPPHRATASRPPRRSSPAWWTTAIASTR